MKGSKSMQCTRKITEDIIYIGASDRRITLFENIIPLNKGVSYNSYLILDEKTVLLDTADYAVGRQFMENLEYGLNGRNLDYLVINHMEPDHCAMISQVIQKYPNIKIVGNSKTFQMMKQFFEFDIDQYSQVVTENETLNTGNHTLQFLMAPMVHWPEVMVTYDSYSKVLFTADAFGTFGALNGNIFNDEIDFDRNWLDDARRYYTNIVGKYGVQVQALLKKTESLDIQKLCPLHGPIWRNNLEYFCDKYNKWSKYEAETDGVVIAYASMYGNTENVCNVLASLLAENGVKNISLFDVSRTDVSEIISEIFKNTHVILATPTYNAEIYPKMASLVLDMKALNVQNKKIVLMENGTWAPIAIKKMREIVESMKNNEIIEKSLSIKSSIKENQLDNLNELAELIAKSVI